MRNLFGEWRQLEAHVTDLVAIYAAKAEGRARHTVFHGGMALAAAELLGLEHDVRLALSRGELSLNHQPEVATSSA